MGVPTSEVGYTPAMPRREDHEVHKGHVVALDQKNTYLFIYLFIYLCFADRASLYNLSNWPTWCTKSCFIRSLLYSSTCFEHYCSHHQEVKLHYTASGIFRLCRWPSGAQVNLRTGQYIKFFFPWANCKNIYGSGLTFPPVLTLTMYKPAGTVMTIIRTSNLAVPFRFPNGRLLLPLTAFELFSSLSLFYFYWDLRRRADGCLPAVISLTGNNGLTVIYSHPAQ